MDPIEHSNPAKQRTAVVTWTIVVVTVVAWLAQELAGGSKDPEILIRFGAKYGPLIADGEWWRLITPIFLHVGFFHLVTNSVGLIVFGSLVERSLGARSYLVIYLAAGIFGNLASYWAAPTLGAGASGSVFGLVGAFGSYLLVNRSVLGDVGRQSFSAVLLVVGINIVFGFTAGGIDNWAHMGGLISGFGLGWWLSPRTAMVQTPDLGFKYYSNATLVLRRATTLQITLAVGVSGLLITLATLSIGKDYPYIDQTGSSGLLASIEDLLSDGDYDEARRRILGAIMRNPAGDEIPLLYLVRGLVMSADGNRIEAINNTCHALSLGLPKDAQRFALSLLTELRGSC